MDTCFCCIPLGQVCHAKRIYSIVWYPPMIVTAPLCQANTRSSKGTAMPNPMIVWKKRLHPTFMIWVAPLVVDFSQESLLFAVHFPGIAVLFSGNTKLWTHKRRSGLYIEDPRIFGMPNYFGSVGNEKPTKSCF
jgi:hypothetical protein